MGLIKKAIESVSSTLGDTWKDCFVCNSLNSSTLMVKGYCGNNNDIITNGSVVIVNDGQCALVVCDGKIREVANEPGAYVYDTGMTPSIFDGGFAGIKNTFKEMITRFTFGGATAKNQCVYYVNTKEILSNLFGSPSPIPFRIVDKNIGLDLDTSVRCNGEYSFKITNPLLFYQAVAGNQAVAYTKEELSVQMRTEFVSALQPVLGKISQTGVRYSEIPTHTEELVEALNEELSEKWGTIRGIEVVSVGLNPITISKEDEDEIKRLQRNATNRDPGMMAANLAAAQAEALREAAKNPNGAFVGIAGMNAVGGSGVSEIIAQTMNQTSQQQTQAARFCPYCGKEVKADARFCSYCGKEL